MYLCYENWTVLHLNKLESPSPKDALCKVWLKLAQWFLRRFLNVVNVFSLFGNYFPLEKGGGLHLNKLESPSPKDALCKVWFNWPSGSGEEGFFYFINVFLLFGNYLPLEKDGALHLYRLEFSSPTDALCQDWLRLVLEKDRTLYLTKLEFPSPKDALCQVWLKWAQRFWRRKVYRQMDRRRTTGDQKSSLELQRTFFIFVNVFSLFWLWFPLGKGSVHSFEQNWTSFIHWYTLCQVWLKFLQW